MPTVKHRIIRAGTIAVAGSGVSLVLGLAVRMVIARVYGPEGMGEYAVFKMFLSLFGTIALFSLPRAVLKFSAEYEERRELMRIRSLFSTIFVALTSSCLLLAIAAQFFAPALSRLINLPADRTLVLFLGLTLIFSTYSSMTASLFMGLLQNFRALIISVSSTLAMICLAAYAYLVHPIPVYLILVGGYVLSGMFGITMVRNQGFLKLEFSRSELKKALLFSSPIILMSYLGFLVEWLDRLVLGIYFGVEEIGLFSAALAVFTPLKKVPVTLTDILIPSYSKISVRGKEALGRVYGKNIQYYAIFYLLFACILILFNRELIELLYTERFMAASGVVLILSGTLILSIITSPGSSLLVGCGYTKLNTANYVLGTSVLIPALFLFSRRWGIHGAAAAILLSHVAAASGILFILTRMIKLKIDLVPLLKVLVTCAGAGILALGVKILFLSPPASLLTLVISYFSGLWMLVLSPADKQNFREIWMRLRSGRRNLWEPKVEWDEDAPGL